MELLIHAEECVRFSPNVLQGNMPRVSAISIEHFAC